MPRDSFEALNLLKHTETSFIISASTERGVDRQKPLNKRRGKMVAYQDKVIFPLEDYDIWGKAELLYLFTCPTTDRDIFHWLDYIRGNLN